MIDRQKLCRVICESGKFETGEGTCSMFCLIHLGPTRGGIHGCPEAARIHGDLADKIIAVLGENK